MLQVFYGNSTRTSLPTLRFRSNLENLVGVGVLLRVGAVTSKKLPQKVAYEESGAFCCSHCN